MRVEVARARVDAAWEEGGDGGFDAFGLAAAAGDGGSSGGGGVAGGSPPDGLALVQHVPRGAFVDPFEVGSRNDVSCKDWAS